MCLTSHIRQKSNGNLVVRSQCVVHSGAMFSVLILSCSFLQIGIMVDAGKDWLEVILLKKAHDESPIKVLSLETSDTSGVVTKGENYMSKIRRVKAKVLLGSGRVKTMSFIIKNQHETEVMKKFSVDLGVFHREIAMYRDILVAMQNLLEEINDPDGIFWPKCYDVRLYDRLVLEDLGHLGYKMANRKTQLGLNASLFVVRHLAKFHALSKILLDRGEIPQNPFGQSAFTSNQQQLVPLTNENVRKFTNFIETRWGAEWEGAVTRIKKHDDLGTVYVKLLDPLEGEFIALCHGDCWTNNMMFKGDPECPTSMRFVDFQIPYVTNPAKDLIYFLITSVQLDIRVKNFDLIIQTYCEALKSFLLKLNYEGSIPGVEDIKDSIKRRPLMPLLDAVSLVPTVLSDMEAAPDVEEMVALELSASVNGKESSKAWNVFERMNPAAEAVLKHEMKEAMKHGAL